MTTKKHYFFKAGVGNYDFKSQLKKNDLSEEADEEAGNDKFIKAASECKYGFFLPIFFGPWKVVDFKEAVENKRGSIERLRPEEHKDQKQIDTFFNAVKNKESSYFWIFCDSKIYALKAVSEISDCNEGEPKPLFNKGSEVSKNNEAKFCKAKIVKRFDSHEIIHKFASLNAFQKYNRKTIVRIEGQESEIANALIESESIVVINPKSKESDFQQKLNYLSPFQLETLVFLIMYEKGLCPACYRGGSGKDYDILLTNSDAGNVENLKDIKYLSVKLNKGNFNNTKNKENKDFAYIFAIDKEEKIKAIPNKCYSLEKAFYNNKFLVESKKLIIDKWLTSQLKLKPLKPFKLLINKKNA